jgi:hypothetical protein
MSRTDVIGVSGRTPCVFTSRVTKSALKDVPPPAARLLRDCQPLTLLASSEFQRKYIKKNLACVVIKDDHLLLEGLNNRMGLEKYNAAPRVSDRATAEYSGFVVPRPSGSWSWSPDSFDILSHARREVHEEFFRMNGVAVCGANCATRKSTVRYEERHKETEPFAPRWSVRVVTPSPSASVYLGRAAYQPHAHFFSSPVTVLPTTDKTSTPTLKEPCTNHAEGVGAVGEGTLGSHRIRAFFLSQKMYCSSSRHVLPRLSRSISRGHRGTRTALPEPVDDYDNNKDDAFQWFPRFFNLVEQHALLSAALRKLDGAEPRASRKRRRDFLASSRHHRPTTTTTRTRTQDQRTHCAALLEDSFLPDHLYHFEEVRHIHLFFSLRLSPPSPGEAIAANLWEPVPHRGEHRVIMTASFDASGKCACQPGMGRRTRF